MLSLLEAPPRGTASSREGRRRVIRGRAGSQTTEEARGAVIGNAEQVTESPHQRAVVSAGTVDGVAGAGTRQRRWTKVGMRVTGQLPAIVNEGNAV